MGLVDLKTDLKSLRYGKDRVGGGSSNQPYIKSSIPKSLSQLDKSGGIDFLLRGGTLTPSRTIEDVSRLTQMFFDFKSPNGLLFTTKQNLLSLSSTNFEAGFKSPKTPRIRATGLSGIDRAIDSVGTFIENNINFTKNNVYTPLSTIGQAAVNSIGGHLFKQGLNPLTGPTKYLDFIKDSDSSNDNNGKGKSRLLSLTNGKLSTFDSFLYSYIGGPKSTNGVGITQLRRYENTNPDPILLSQNPGLLGYSDLTSLSSKTDEGKGNTKVIDFRNSVTTEGLNLNNTKRKSLDYTISSNRIEKRVNLGDPGRKGKNISSYTQGVDGLNSPLDKITSHPLYKATTGDDKGNKNDLVSFRIGIIDNNTPGEKTYIHFRAFIDQMSDSYNAQWDAQKFMGRGESFYKYSGFNRNITLGWTVAAQSKAELIPMYHKLNYLASSLTPDYSKEIGYMRGNLVTLTIGGYLYEQTGIITSLNYSVPTESPWEIALSDNTTASVDGSVKELPHIIQVTGFNFIPIHDFVPKVNTLAVKSPGESITYGDFGPERYISLSKGGEENNYNKSVTK